TINASSPSSNSVATLHSPGTVTVLSGTFNAFNVNQISGSTLSGGTWKVFGGSTLKLGSGAFGMTALTSNDAGGVVDGAGSAVANFAGQLATNLGSFTVENGATLTTQGPLVNTGTVVIDNNASGLTTTGNYSQSGAASRTDLKGGKLKSLTSTISI